ncbi:unnamed protein product, partial [marine sediment metagenome]
DNILSRVQLPRDTVFIVKGEDKIRAAMRLRRTEDDRVNVGTEGGGLEQVVTRPDPITNNIPHSDPVVDPRLAEVTFHLGLEPEWMEYSDTTIDTVVPRASVATPEQRRVDTFPIPTIVGDLLRSNAEDATIGALPRCSSVCLNFESNLKRGPTSPIFPTPWAHNTPTAQEIVASSRTVRRKVAQVLMTAEGSLNTKSWELEGARTDRTKRWWSLRREVRLNRCLGWIVVNPLRIVNVERIHLAPIHG